MTFKPYQQVPRLNQEDMDWLHTEALMMDADIEKSLRWQAERDERTCIVHPERKAYGYVYVMDDGLFKESPRCQECMDGANNVAVSNAVKLAADAWKSNPACDMRYYSDQAGYFDDKKGLK